MDGTNGAPASGTAADGAPDIRLAMMTAADVTFRLRWETDPLMTAELGGPRPVEDIERAHERSLVLAAEGRCWPLKVYVAGSADIAAGVSVFESAYADEPIFEIGWATLPEFQGRGIASRAVAMILDKARAEERFGQLHAFPAVTNAPSNKVCANNGFTNLGETPIEFAGRTLHCHHWSVDLF